MSLLNILLMAPQQGAEGGGGWSSMIFLGGIIVVFWLFFIRPQVKKQKDQKKYREALKKGDRVVTIGGINGKIIEMHDEYIIIESEGSRLRIEKSAVAMDESSRIQEKK